MLSELLSGKSALSYCANLDHHADEKPFGVTAHKEQTKQACLANLIR